MRNPEPGSFNSARFSGRKQQCVQSGGVEPPTESLGPGRIDDDPPVLEAVGAARLMRGDIREAVGFEERAVAKQPGSADYALNLAYALEAAADSEGVERQLKRAIDLDPSLERAYMELANLYYDQQKKPEALAVVNRYLRWNPQSIKFHVQRARLLEEEKKQ